MKSKHGLAGPPNPLPWHAHTYGRPSVQWDVWLTTGGPFLPGSCWMFPLHEAGTPVEYIPQMPVVPGASRMSVVQAVGQGTHLARDSGALRTS